MADLGNSAVLSQNDASNGSGTMPSWLGSAAPSTLDDAGRALQGAVTREWNWRNYTLTSGGTGTALTLTYSVAPAAYYNGQRFAFTSLNVTGSCTLNVNNLGAKTIKKPVGGALTNLAANDIASGAFVEVAYNSSNDCFVWVNSLGALTTTSTSLFVSTSSYLYSYAGGTSNQSRSGLYLDGTNNILWFLTNTTQHATLSSSGDFTLVTGGLIGYGTGSGGSVTQTTSKTTAVTINTTNGKIIMNDGNLNAGQKATFSVNNSKVSASDTIVVSVGTIGTGDTYRANVTYVTSEAFYITVENIASGAFAENVVLNFAVIKAVTA